MSLFTSYNILKVFKATFYFVKKSEEKESTFSSANSLHLNLHIRKRFFLVLFCLCSCNDNILTLFRSIYLLP